MEARRFIKGRQVALFGVLLLSHALLSSSGGTPQAPWEQQNVSFPMLNQEIRHQLEEHQRQKDLRGEQSLTLGLERSNNGEWNTYQRTSGQIKARLNQVSALMQLAPYGVEVTQRARRIRELEAALFRELSLAPMLVPQALEEKLKWAQQLELTLRYLIGLSASLGVVNQMEAADRKILLDFALEELGNLESQSRLILFRVQNARQVLEAKKNLMLFYLVRDKALVGSILNDLKLKT